MEYHVWPGAGIWLGLLVSLVFLGTVELGLSAGNVSDSQLNSLVLVWYSYGVMGS